MPLHDSFALRFSASVWRRRCSASSPDSKVYCDFIARYGHDYQQDLGSGICPRTFSIVGVMAWQAPEWGTWRSNQNGVFPFNRDSTAFAVDYLGVDIIFWSKETPWLRGALLHAP